MTPAKFRSRLKATGLTIRGFASLTGVHHVTAANWGKKRSGTGMQQFPAWVPLLLSAWERAPAKTAPASAR